MAESPYEDSKTEISDQRSGIRKLVAGKKRRHERFSVRAGRPVTQLTPSTGAALRANFITGINTAYYRFGF
jgi:hypothetical protein